MSRDQSLRHVPYCETRVAHVDQYMWSEVDTTERKCTNGLSHPVYSCDGTISRTLPLDMWPTVNEVHPQIRMSSQPHFISRNPAMARQIELTQLDLASKRLEGFYINGGGYDPYRERERRLDNRKK